MNAADRKQFVPGYRGILRPISEAGGQLTRIEEIVDDNGLDRLLEAVDLGLVIYEAGDLMFVGAGDYRIYAELLDRVEAGYDGDENNDAADVDERVDDAPPLSTAAE